MLTFCFVPCSEKAPTSTKKFFIEQWSVSYRISAYFVINNPQFVNEFFLAIGYFVGNKKITMTALHPGTNGLFERYSETLVAMVWEFISGEQDSCDQVIQPQIYAYNWQLQRSTGETLSRLTLTRDAPEPANGHIPISIRTDSTRDTPWKEKRHHILLRIFLMRAEVEKPSIAAQTKSGDFFDKFLQGPLTFIAKTFVYMDQPQRPRANE